MALIRPVLMNDGVVRREHTIISIKHSYTGACDTCITVESTAADETIPAIQTSIYYALEEGLSVEDAYNRISTHPQFNEYEDDAQIAIDILKPMLTDEQAELVTRFFPEWEPDISYSVGDRVKYGSKLYRCLQAHRSQTGWEPPVVASLWTRTSANPDVIEDWVQPTGAQDAYHLGDKVRHNNEDWVSTIDANVWEPGVYGWQTIIGGV